MFVLEEVANKIEEILNGFESNYEFSVQTQGYHLDKIANHESGKNFIPVFIELTSGDIEPIPSLNMASYNIETTIYFPVRFKHDFFVLQDKINNAFCGQTIDIGTLTGKCVSNLSIPTYGEIQDLDLNEFKEWVENIYRKEISVSEPYQTMTFTLYFGTVKQGIPFGNNVDYYLSYTYKDENGTSISKDEVKLLWDIPSSQIDISTVGQQLFMYPRQGILPNITTRASSILFYADDNDTIATLFNLYYKGELDAITSIKLKKIIKDSGRYNGTYTYDNVIVNFEDNVERGAPLSATITFGDKAKVYGE